MTLAGIRQDIGAGENLFTRILRLLFLVLVAAVFCFLAIVPLSWPQQAILGLLSLVMALVLARISDSYLITLMLMMLSIFCTFRYGYWRVEQVVRFFQDPANHWEALDVFFILCLLLAEAYAFAILFLGYFQTIWPLRRAPVALPENPDDWPEIDVLIPTYNERLNIALICYLLFKHLKSVSYPSLLLFYAIHFYASLSFHAARHFLFFRVVEAMREKNCSGEDFSF